MTIEVIVIVALFVGYLWTGWEMVIFHTLAHAIDQPTYVSKGISARASVSLIWPYVSKRNRELGWFLASFIATSLLVTATIYYVTPQGVPIWAIVAAIPVLRIIPGVSLLVNIPIALMAGLLFIVLAKPFGANFPTGMERMSQR